MQYITEQQIDQLAGETGRILREEPKVHMIIPSGHENDKYWEGGINGHFFRIQTDVEVDLPESLYKQIQHSRRVQRISAAAVEAYTKGAGKKINS